MGEDLRDMCRLRGLVLGVLCGALGLWGAAMDGPAQAEPLNLSPDGLILKGHDPVAYFTERDALLGDPDISATHDGARYHFATQANRAAFLAEPERYAPAYGGHCSYGVRMGQKLDIDPEAWRIVDGRLFVQLDHGTRLVWMLDETNNIEVADAVWPQIKDEPAVAD